MNEEDYNIFTQKNNVNLNNEIDSLSFKDINLRDGFIKISETTPFIYQKLGLKNLPVHVYIQKLARALFLEKESYGERRTHGHKNEFSLKEMKSVFENISNPRYIFNSKQNFYNSEKLTLIGVYDEFDKYGNPMIITICFDKNKYSTEAKWVTSIYGKNKDVIVNDWTEKGYLLYKNDVEIKKASEEVVTLYMRINKSSNAYKNNILLKSQLVNKNSNPLIENDREEFFYDQSLSTIEKDRFLESIKKIPKVLNQINRLEYFGNSDGTPSTYYDKRLINICQVPQMPYLEKVNGKWLPTKETVNAVKTGKLYIQKNGQEYRMIDNRSSQKNDDMSFYYENFARMLQKENEVAQLQKALALALEKNVLPLKEVELNRENWNKMFPDGTVETPVATIKLGENQFGKLCRSDRNNLLAAMYETLSNPAIVLEKETLDEKSGEFKLVNVYGKSFIHEDSKHKRAVESVIIFKDGKNISIGTHNKNIKDFVKQIKTADQIIYTDSEISRVASLILQNGGSRVRLHDAISNRVINSHYDKNNLLSINNLQFSESKNNLNENIQFEYDGLTYIPIRALSENEKEMINNQTPKNYWSNSIIEKPKNGENYSIEDFKKKSQSQDVDLFYCIERGKFFTPVENGIINLNEGSIDEHFRKELSDFYNNENIQELIKNHRPLVFNEKEDISLMKNISSVLTESEVFYKNNETLGNIRVKFGNLKHGGVIHIIKHEGMNYDDAVKETSAILFLSLQNISNAPATKETDGRYAIYKDGIKTAIGKDKNGRYVVTGFNFNDTKQEAADAIKSVNALYGYTPEFLEIYTQVGAAYASLNNNITQQNSPVNDKKSDYEKLLYSSAEINVNGTIRHCKDGLIKGFENAVSRLESYFAENSSLKNENARLKSQIECMNSKCEKLIQDNEELKKQALKNKIRPMGM